MIVHDARRRLALAAASLAIAAVLFRGSVASALVTRGDDFTRAGHAERAIVMYRRAVRFAPNDAAAADRLAFALMMRARTGDARAALDVADAALRAVPDSALLLADRGFAAERLRRWDDARQSFARAGTLAHDPRFLHLAARMAERGRDIAAARRHLRAALAFDPSYAPARAALGGLRP